MRTGPAFSTVNAMPSARVLAPCLILATLTLAGLSACNLTRNTLVDGLTTASTVTEVNIADGGSGDVAVAVDASIHEVNVKRTVHYGGSAPAQTAHVEGSTLVLGMDCGNACSVSYDVKLPATAKVTGSTSSGNVILSGVSGVDITGSSGDITVNRVDGPVNVSISSGDIELTGLTGSVNAKATSGNIGARDISGGVVRLEATSGDVELSLTLVGDVGVQTTSGNIEVHVPPGAVRVDTDVSSGDVRVDVPTDPNAPRRLDLHASSGDITVEPQ
jgi:Putative adhesin